eukprot:8772840-Karenia_brevis.AAC.1
MQEHKNVRSTAHKSSTKPDLSSGLSTEASSALQFHHLHRNGPGVEDQLAFSRRKRLVQIMRSINAMNLDGINHYQDPLSALR